MTQTIQQTSGDNMVQFRQTLEAAPFEKRMEVLKRLSADAGLRLPETFLPEGTALLPMGESAKRKMEQTLDALPDLATALAGLQFRLDMENALDIPGIVPSTLRLASHDGVMYRVQPNGQAGSALAYNSTGFSHAAAFIKPHNIRNGFVENMLALPPKLRADVFNHWAVNTHRNDEGLTFRTLVEPNSGKRYVRAVTSNKHSLETGDDGAIVRAFAQGTRLPDGAKVRITREPDRSEFELIWPAMKREVRVGDPVQIGVRITNSETKAGALTVEAFILRTVCYNFTTAYSTDDEAVTFKLRHVGDLSRRLPRLLSNAIARVEPLVVAFGDAYNVSLPAPRGDMLAKARKALKLPEYVINSAAQLWDADGAASAGDTLAGLHNALTRAARDLPIETAGEVERAAGELVTKGLSLLRQ